MSQCSSPHDFAFNTRIDTAFNVEAQIRSLQTKVLVDKALIDKVRLLFHAIQVIKHKSLTRTKATVDTARH